VDQARGMAFFTLLLADLFLCWVSLSHRPFWSKDRFSNISFYWVAGGVLVGLFLLMLIPFTASLFHMDRLTFGDFMLAITLAAASTLWAEAPKLMTKKAWRKNQAC
jgi:magnesium-transporting ATPase (P-type)